MPLRLARLEHALTRPIEDLAAELLRLAEAKQVSISTAESCTAGAAATALADAPGAGLRFHGGIVVYTKRSKTEWLGVPADLLAERSAVCRDVAVAMADGLLARSPAGVAIAITGVAGPEPDEDGNPVGLMHVAVRLRMGGGGHRELRLPNGHRDELRHCAVRAALDLAIEVIGSSRDG